MSFRIGLVLLVFCLFVGPAHAQSDTETQIAPDDSTKTMTWFDRLGVQPEYRSSFRVNRTSTNWDESLQLNEQFGSIAFATDWNVGFQQNPTQNDRRQQTGKGRVSLEHVSDTFGGWSFGTAGELNQRSSRTDFSSQTSNDSEIGLVLSSGGLGEALRRNRDWAVDTFTWDVTGTAGITSEYTASERRSREEGNPLDRADSTDASGFLREISTELFYAPRESWTVTVDAKANRVREDFKTDLAFPDSSAVLEGTNENENETFNVTASWKPSRDTSFEFRHNRVHDVSQEFSTTELAQDTRTGTERSVSLSLKGEPFWGVEHLISASNRFLDTEYVLADRGAGSDGYSLGGTHSVKLGRLWGPVQKTALEFEWRWGEKALSYDTGNSYDSETVKARFRVERPFGKRLVVTGQSETNLEQTFYEGGENDRDVLDQRLESNFKYDLREGVETKLNVFWKKKRSLNIREAKALANFDETNVTVTASYGWDLRPGMKLGQDYIVTAVSSELPFDDSKSDLARTSQLQTTFAGRIGERVDLRLEHKFQFKDSGRYELEEDRTRRFAKETEGTQQWLETEASYRVLRRFVVFINQRYEIRIKENSNTGKISRRPRTELKWGWNLLHDFNEEFGITTKFDRVNATDELSYWKGSASLTKAF